MSPAITQYIVNERTDPLVDLFASAPQVRELL